MKTLQDPNGDPQRSCKVFDQLTDQAFYGDQGI